MVIEKTKTRRTRVFKKLFKTLADEQELWQRSPTVGASIGGVDFDNLDIDSLNDDEIESIISVSKPRKHDINVYIVDGEYVRDNINSEFTNYGQHYRFPFIPTNEIWLDKEYGRSEKEAFIAHAIKERELMKNGVEYNDAYETSKKDEKPYREHEDGNVRKKLLYITNNGLSVWLVDGKRVRSNYSLDFTQGGHDKVYGFIPRNEVWIDDDLSVKEREPVILHEVNERNLMSGGMRYLPAHKRSAIKELKYRKMTHGFIPGGQINTRIMVAK